MANLRKLFWVITVFAAPYGSGEKIDMPEYTDKQKRVLEIVKTEIALRRCCKLSHSQLAQLAGVGKWTVRAAMDKARIAGEIVSVRRQDDGLSNVIALPPLKS